MNTAKTKPTRRLISDLKTAVQFIAHYADDDPDKNDPVKLSMHLHDAAGIIGELNASLAGGRRS